MEIRLAQAQDIDGWMALIEQLRAVFPGLETAAAMEEHRAAVLHFIESSAAVCAVQEGRIAGALLFSAQRGELCFLAVDPAFRRRGIGRGLFSFLLSRMEEGRDISLITYPADDPNGQAARAFYRHLGFSAGRMACAFGHPAQEFILRRGGR